MCENKCLLESKKVLEEAAPCKKDGRPSFLSFHAPLWKEEKGGRCFFPPFSIFVSLRRREQTLTPHNSPRKNSLSLSLYTHTIKLLLLHAPHLDPPPPRAPPHSGAQLLPPVASFRARLPAIPASTATACSPPTPPPRPAHGAVPRAARPAKPDARGGRRPRRARSAQRGPPPAWRGGRACGPQSGRPRTPAPPVQ